LRNLLKLPAGFDDRADSFFALEIDTPGREQRRRGIVSADPLLPQYRTRGAVEARGHSGVRDLVDFVADDQNGRRVLDALFRLPGDMRVRHVAVSVGPNREQSGERVPRADVD